MCHQMHDIIDIIIVHVRQQGRSIIIIQYTGTRHDRHTDIKMKLKRQRTTSASPITQLLQYRFNNVVY